MEKLKNNRLGEETRAAQEMVFCYQNFSDLLWEKKYSSDREKVLKFEAKGREFAKYNLNNLFKQWKVRTIFGNRMLF